MIYLLKTIDGESFLLAKGDRELCTKILRMDCCDTIMRSNVVPSLEKFSADKLLEQTGGGIMQIGHKKLMWNLSEDNLRASVIYNEFADVEGDEPHQVYWKIEELYEPASTDIPCVLLDLAFKFDSNHPLGAHEETLRFALNLKITQMVKPYHEMVDDLLTDFMAEVNCDSLYAFAMSDSEVLHKFGLTPVFPFEEEHEDLTSCHLAGYAMFEEFTYGAYVPISQSIRS